MRDAVVGVILAGGEGRRLGGAKATVMLAGRPLIAWPLQALRDALGPPAPIAIVAKPGSVLPSGLGVPVWFEPETPSHPLVGLVRALEGAAGRPALVCPVDVPFVAPATLTRLAGGTGVAVLAAAGGSVQPLLGRWEATAVQALRTALTEDPLPAMRAVAARLGATAVEVDPGELDNVNTPEDLAAAQRRLISRR